MVILRATSILGEQKEDKGMMCSILLGFDTASTVNMLSKCFAEICL
jgi:hypothetical protein